MCQHKYSLDIISEVGLLGAKPTGFPMEENHWLMLADGILLDDPKRYRIIYLCFTRPELSYSVHVFSQLMKHPWEKH